MSRRVLSLSLSKRDAQMQRDVVDPDTVQADGLFRWRFCGRSCVDGGHSFEHATMESCRSQEHSPSACDTFQTHVRLSHGKNDGDRVLFVSRKEGKEGKSQETAVDEGRNDR